ncbi:MAG: DUF4089 domain-containing protein [Hyphomicrobium sp.]|uniref:DUF4089 domain-containing protein n=1 Tax=Hyphomicrobium sp. TaxID=82 RepID=UPI003D0970B0
MTTHETRTLVEAAAANLGLSIEPEWMPNVMLFFGVACTMAKLIEDTGAAAASEAAPVFTPRSSG